MSESLWHASALDAQTAVVWRATSSGVALVMDEAGQPLTAPDLGTLLAQSPDEVVAMPLTPPERARLIEALHAVEPDRSRLHVSPVVGFPVPMAFAWRGPDELHGQPPQVLTRGTRYALWPGASPEDAVARALADLAAHHLVAVAAPCPPEAMTLSQRLTKPAAALTTP